MWFTILLFLLTTLSRVESTTAAPAASSSRDHFTIQQRDAKPDHRQGSLVLRQLYSKYDKVPPTEVEAAARTAESAVLSAELLLLAKNDGTVVTSPAAFDVSYLCPVMIGGQTLNLDFDTGSSDLWVYSSQLPSSQLIGHAYYDPKKSKTSKLMRGYKWAIGYGDGSSASGNVYTDVVQIGRTSYSQQAVELAQKVSRKFTENLHTDGLLGFAFDQLNMVSPQRQKTFFSNVKKSLVSPLFTADLKKGRPGSFDFGFINDTKRNGPITYAPVDATSGYWMFSTNGYAIGSKTFVTQSINGIADTGSTLLLMPIAIVAAYYKQVSGAVYKSSEGGYVFPCNAQLPSLTIGINSYKAVIPGDYINYGPLGYENLCFGGLQRNTNIGFSIFGIIFLKSQFAIFDANGPRLGLAPKILK